MGKTKILEVRVYLNEIKNDPAGARTQDPLLKRQMLYQLSYRVIIKF